MQEIKNKNNIVIDKFTPILHSNNLINGFNIV